MPDKIAFVDIETTGSNLGRDRIIEIGVLRVENNRLVSTFQSLVNPESYLPPEITALTGISGAELSRAPTFAEIARQLLEILDGCLFAAHNARFDYGFIKRELEEYGVRYRAQNFCTLKFSRLLFPRIHRHNLDNIIEHFNLNCECRHRALADARVLWDFYRKVNREVPPESLEKIISQVLKRPTRPVNLTEKDLERLPEGPGIYIFYDREGMPLYVGKSVNLRERVLSHFAADTESPREAKIARQIASFETLPTDNELEALLLEAKKIKEMQPLYNRRLRLTQKLILLKQKNLGDYRGTELAAATRIDKTETENILGIFRSQRKAKDFLTQVAKEYQLCEKLLGLENAKAACFAYRLGRCRGACQGKEKPGLYNARFALAFRESRIARWPFSGPIIIEGERVVDNWCLLGEEFDLDTYKILQRYFKNIKNHKKIRRYQFPPRVFSAN